MRTVTFQSVVDAILRRHNIDPAGDAWNRDTGEAIAEHVNDRIRTAYRVWPFPEFTHTQEMAYRPRWNANKQFLRIGANGKPDELFYIPNATYYKVLSTAPSDPPIGTLPTDTTYFEVLSPVDTYIAFDETCRHSIEQVIGIYKSNPRLNGCNPRELCLCYRPSEFGIDVCNPPGPTVFVQYMIPPPEFTFQPYVDGKAFKRGDRRFYAADGNCYRALVDGINQPPTNTTYWTQEQLPKVLARYIKAGAYADCLKETFTEGEEQVRLERAALADAEAEGYLHQEIDALITQGQRYFYTRPLRYPSGVCVSQPWTGAVVSELTDACEDDATYPPPPTLEQLGFLYFSTVKSLKDVGTPPTLVASVPTLNLAVGVMAVISTGQHFRLDAGAADNTDPGQGAPADYDATTNNKHWVEVL